VLWHKYRDKGIGLTVSDQSKREIQDIFRQRRENGQDTKTLLREVEGAKALRQDPGTITIREILNLVFPEEVKRGRSGRGRKKKTKVVVKEEEEEEEEEDPFNDDDDDE